MFAYDETCSRRVQPSSGQRARMPAAHPGPEALVGPANHLLERGETSKARPRRGRGEGPQAGAESVSNTACLNGRAGIQGPRLRCKQGGLRSQPSRAPHVLTVRPGPPPRTPHSTQPGACERNPSGRERATTKGGSSSRAHPASPSGLFPGHRALGTELSSVASSLRSHWSCYRHCVYRHRAHDTFSGDVLYGAHRDPMGTVLSLFFLVQVGR